MNLVRTPLGPIVLRHERHSDDRGSLQEVFVSSLNRHSEGYLLQVNLLRSRRGVVRGLHYNITGHQWKLVMAISGMHWSVAVDVRKNSPTAGQWYGEYLGEGANQLWVPPGFAHGILCLSDGGIAQYMTNMEYDPSYERGLAFNSDVGVQWPLADSHMVVSTRDRQVKTLKEFWASYD